MRHKRDTWSWTAGQYGAAVRVFERRRGGILYAGVRGHDGKTIRRSLNHRDRERAKEWAKQQAGKLAAGFDEIRAGKITLARLLAAYRTRKGECAERRLQELWCRVLGGERDPHKITEAELREFERARKAGAIDAHGNPIPEGERRPVRWRAVEYDIARLKTFLRWGLRNRDPHTGAFYLRENPLRGFEPTKEKNPRRAVATRDRYEKIREKAGDVTMEVIAIRDGKRTRRKVPTYLPELLDIVVGTGRRISAVCGLRYQDIRLEPAPGAPHGAIVWPEDTDKMGKEWRCPISKETRTALERQLRRCPGIGAAPLFPSPRDPSKPIARYLADKWLLEAEDLAKVLKLSGSLWHCYRRMWASERKGLPDVDVAAAGGWSSLTALKTIYQQPDDATLFRVVTGNAELREAKA